MLFLFDRRQIEDTPQQPHHFDCLLQYQDDLGVTTYARDTDGNAVELVEYPDRYHEEALQL